MEGIKKKIEKLRIELDETKEKLEESESKNRSAIDRADAVSF